MEASPKLKSSPPENALVASEARYRRLFETARDGILILDAQSGMITDVNPFLTTLLDYSREDFLGKTPLGHWCFQANSRIESRVSRASEQTIYPLRESAIGNQKRAAGQCRVRQQRLR